MTVRGRWKVAQDGEALVEAPQDTSWRDRAQKELEQARRRPQLGEAVTVREGQIVSAKEASRT